MAASDNSSDQVEQEIDATTPPEKSVTDPMMGRRAMMARLGASAAVVGIGAGASRHGSVPSPVGDTRAAACGGACLVGAGIAIGIGISYVVGSAGGGEDIPLDPEDVPHDRVYSVLAGLSRERRGDTGYRQQLQDNYIKPSETPFRGALWSTVRINAAQDAKESVPESESISDAQDTADKHYTRALLSLSEQYNSLLANEQVVKEMKGVLSDDGAPNDALEIRFPRGFHDTEDGDKYVADESTTTVSAVSESAFGSRLPSGAKPVGASEIGNTGEYFLWKIPMSLPVNDISDIEGRESSTAYIWGISVESSYPVQTSPQILLPISDNQKTAEGESWNQYNNRTPDDWAINGISSISTGVSSPIAGDYTDVFVGEWEGIVTPPDDALSAVTWMKSRPTGKAIEAIYHDYKQAKANLGEYITTVRAAIAEGKINPADLLTPEEFQSKFSDAESRGALLRNMMTAGVGVPDDKQMQVRVKHPSIESSDGIWAELYLDLTEDIDITIGTEIKPPQYNSAVIGFENAANGNFDVRHLSPSAGSIVIKDMQHPEKEAVSSLVGKSIQDNGVISVDSLPSDLVDKRKSDDPWQLVVTDDTGAVDAVPLSKISDNPDTDTVVIPTNLTGSKVDSARLLPGLEFNEGYQDAPPNATKTNTTVVNDRLNTSRDIQAAVREAINAAESGGGGLPGLGDITDGIGSWLIAGLAVLLGLLGLNAATG
jgi:hypothetical protein